MASRIRDNARVLLEVYRGTATAIREETRYHSCGRMAGG